MLVFEFLRKLFGRKRRGTPPQREDLEVAPHPTDDPELQQMLDQIDRKAMEAIQNERTAEALLTPRERIKKRLNLPRELSADYRADESVPVLSPGRKRDAVPLVVVVNNVGIGIRIPRVLFEYLYRQCSLTTDDQHVINDALMQWGLNPESL
jgi:hypothetical protein